VTAAVAKRFLALFAVSGALKALASNFSPLAAALIVQMVRNSSERR
jgi:hypothetical protein